MPAASYTALLVCLHIIAPAPLTSPAAASTVAALRSLSLVLASSTMVPRVVPRMVPRMASVLAYRAVPSVPFRAVLAMLTVAAISTAAPPVPVVMAVAPAVFTAVVVGVVVTIPPTTHRSVRRSVSRIRGCSVPSPAMTVVLRMRLQRLVRAEQLPLLLILLKAQESIADDSVSRYSGSLAKSIGWVLGADIIRLCHCIDRF